MKVLSIITLVLISSSAFAVIDGKYASECEMPEETNVQSSGKELVTYAKGVFIHEFIEYSDRNCTIPTSSQSEKGTYSEQVKTKVVAGKNNIDFTVESLLLTQYSKAQVDFFNSMKYCGFSDWTVGLAKDVTHLNCNYYLYPTKGGTAIIVPQEYSLEDYPVVHDIYKVENGLLYLGDSNNEEGPADARPTALSDTPRYKLVK